MLFDGLCVCVRVQSVCNNVQVGYLCQANIDLNTITQGASTEHCTEK